MFELCPEKVIERIRDIKNPLRLLGEGCRASAGAHPGPILPRPGHLLPSTHKS